MHPKILSNLLRLKKGIFVYTLFTMPLNLLEMFLMYGVINQIIFGLLLSLFLSYRFVTILIKHFNHSDIVSNIKLFSKY